MDQLEAELEANLLGAMLGDPWGPILKGRLETAARSVLFRHGIRNARVVAKMGPRGVEVEVLLPPGPARVERICIQVGGG